MLKPPPGNLSRDVSPTGISFYYSRAELVLGLKSTSFDRLWIPISVMMYVVSSIRVVVCVCASGPQATEWSGSSLSRLFDQNDSSPYFLFSLSDSH